MKKIKLFTQVSAGIFSLTCLPVLAHSGHDHSAVDSGLIHLFWLSPIIIAAALFVFKEIKSSSRDK